MKRKIDTLENAFYKKYPKYYCVLTMWKEANGEDCKRYIRDIVEIYANYGFLGETQIICAAIRTPKQFVDCAVAGADIVTAGLAVYKDSIKHPYTRQGIETFCEAWDNTAGN